ncbi:ABC transporter permease [Kiritimatiella glycovorans]|uniref:Lipoprotein releasing system, transmembrane protein, LolC/E family n=1 Tax=Kiritimatiella glycovorans TaxID=1307763 RepID=A0A0G3EHF1_9BACT|nr:ABC transporter permease [Kiritimatiella glycovorans]AKJ64812.1 lipoprotein releasing system, transmembrane protein, LolC/E family [Kiritimatiella glycovorans]
MLSKAGRLALLATKQLWRHPVRTSLTLLGVASGMFLFTTVQTMQTTLDRATRVQAADTTLVVYRENRFCPQTSRLPEYYENEIRAIPGVREVIPIKVTVNNCGASLDVITFRGVPPGQLARYAPEIAVIRGSYDDWKNRDDGALVGKQLADKRGLQPGDAFEAVGVRVIVSGIIDSPLPQDNAVAYVHLPFLQQASRHGLGVVTQFNVRVQPGEDIERVATAIDKRFKSETEPTVTQPEKAFFAQTARELIDLIGFTRWIGYGAVLAVVGLIANAVLLVVRGRVRENAILQTVGFPESAVGFVVVSEGAVLGFVGSCIGIVLASGFLAWRGLTFGNEGQTLALVPDASVMATGLGLALVLGMTAALGPAWIAMRRPIVESLRS